MTLLQKIRQWLFVFLIIGAPLSKYPSIANPEYNFTSFRFGLYQLAALVFVLVCTVPTIKYLKQFYQQNKTVFISSMVLLITIITGLALALDKKRAILLGLSFIFLLVLLACSWWYVARELKKESYIKFIKIFLYAGIVFALLSVAEFFILTFTSVKSGILCTGCYSNVFGFPRINLFAAEPQFLASAMLPFFFVSAAFVYKNRNKIALYCLILTTLAISLTFSRGAYFAIGAGLLSYMILLAVYKKLSLKPLMVLIATIVLTFVLGGLMLVWSATYKFNSTPNIAYNTAATMLDHMSLGIINIPIKTAPVKTPQNQTNFVSPGLIKSSTEDRVGAANLALDSWHHSAQTTFIGVGPGNLGPYTVKNIDSTAPNNLTVYIYYVLLIAEVGLVGLIAFLLINISSISRFVNGFKSNKNSELYASLAALMIAFLAQYLFFGTFINSVYIWVWTGVILGLTGVTLRKKRYNKKTHEE